ncbi:MAG TPA: type II secretion system protein [Thermoanaerobaculia bacterium]|jgi:prepilin-type N-terminal cleavage/methylation domain-containing protein|nr:type II secretion system protein [Thermoanaerobaculia bacterium]
MNRQAGFTLVELLISLVLMSLALALAGQVMMEGAQMLTDAAAEQADAPMPLVAARLRGDIRAAAGFEVIKGLEGPALLLEGHPAGLVVYQKVGDELRRTVVEETGKIRGEGPALRSVTSWSCAPIAPGLVAVSLSHRRSAIRRGVLPMLPGNRGPRSEERSETFLAAPRGAGLGSAW